MSCSMTSHHATILKHTSRKQRSRLLGIWHSNWCTLTENCPWCVFARTKQLPESLDGRRKNALDLPRCCVHQLNSNLSYRIQQINCQTCAVWTSRTILSRLSCVYPRR